jgi:hypothetical protein
MNCQKCGSARIAMLSGKCADLCHIRVGQGEHSGYVPDDMGIGQGEMIDLSYCLDCGTIQGGWPLPLCKLEESEEDDDDHGW